MIVVALVGILSSIAIPNYQKFVARARQSEAKVALAAMYAAELAYVGEAGTYSNCLRQMGYAPEGSQKYYVTGSAGSGTLSAYCKNCGGDEAQDCLYYNWSGGMPAGPLCASADFSTNVDGDVAFLSNARVNSALDNYQLGLYMSGEVTTCPDVSTTTFKLHAVGSISSKSTPDIWRIDENKVIVNSQSGI